MLSQLSVFLILVCFVSELSFVACAPIPGVPRIPQCKPSLGLNQRQCTKRMRACNKNGKFPPRMKWNTPGGCDNGKPAGDSGCQCAPYCGYTCEQACAADKSCFWDVDVCKSKETGLPTGPITNCNTCLFQKCFTNATQSCNTCDANTECVNGVCLTRITKPCDSNYHCASGECTQGKCTEAEQCAGVQEQCFINRARALDVVQSLKSRNLGIFVTGTCCNGLACQIVEGDYRECCRTPNAPCEGFGGCCAGLTCSQQTNTCVDI